ncbi:MAG: autotransporter [Solirubrobacterales bacterium]
MVTRNRIHRSLAAAGALAAAAGTFAVAGTAGASGPTASGARTITLNDTGRLHETSHRGFNLYESGSATGTIRGSVSMRLDVVSTNRVTAELTVHASGGSMSGNASGAYRNNGATASFSGTLSITHGTGKYSHAHGSGISFSGTIQRTSGAVTVRVNGHLSA